MIYNSIYNVDKITGKSGDNTNIGLMGISYWDNIEEDLSNSYLMRRGAVHEMANKHTNNKSARYLCNSIDEHLINEMYSICEILGYVNIQNYSTEI
jgi:hypothetical protein